jgi:DNA invertase Pin-like site-specific DNA recombinase
MAKYILYARKSTDAEDRQVLSIEAQIAELRKFAGENNLEIIDELVEKRTAKCPGRPIFNEMLERIQNGEANGILSWHPDRLARNSVDGGQIIFLTDNGVITNLAFPSFWFDTSPQGKFMLNMAFSQSKYYVDNLSENVKRGLRQKVRRGEMPGLAPIGYINDKNTKRIVRDRRISPKIVAAFELYSQGDKTMSEIAQFLFDNGIKTDGHFHKRNGVVSAGGRKLKDDRIKKILQNPFYYGHFLYNGELSAGRHEPIISKALYDKCQKVMSGRGHIQPEVRPTIPFLRLLRCSCGMAITAEMKTKTQKNGNSHHWTYYRCSRKNKAVRCVQPAVRENDLYPQISALLLRYSLPTEATNWLLEKIETDKDAENDKNKSVSENLRAEITAIIAKQKLLLDSYLEQAIDREVFMMKKAELASEKATFDEKLARLERGGSAWVEPMRKWVLEISSICKIIADNDFASQKAQLRKMFGSNLLLIDKSLIASGDLENPAVTQKPRPAPISGRGFCTFDLYEKVADFNKKSRSESKDFKFIIPLATLYDFARTYFTLNSEN